MTPDEHTIAEHFLDVGDAHELYIQDWGNKNAAIPIIYIHGGPGGGCSDSSKASFDPQVQRVIFYDQRGCGRSLPYGSLEHNTTSDLVSDIDKIADKFGIDRFILTGASWGPCLALAYALAHPDKVHALVLRSIFTGSQNEIDYLYDGGYRAFFPEVWQRLLAVTPKRYHSSPKSYHMGRALQADDAQASASAKALIETESALVKLDDRHTPIKDKDFKLEQSRIEIHYLANRCFLPDRYILENASKLTMPVWLVHGRYDFVCPPQTAFELHDRLPNSQLIWTTSGHLAEREAWNVVRTILLQLTAHS